jgi:hypothetical protein
MRRHVSIRNLLPWLLVLLLVPAGVVAGQRATPAPDCPPVATTPVTLGTYELHGNVYTFTGTGKTVSQPFTLHQGLVIVSYNAKDPGGMLVVIHTYPDGSAIQGGVITVWNNGTGMVAARTAQDGEYVVQVESSGSWDIVIGQP